MKYLKAGIGLLSGLVMYGCASMPAKSPESAHVNFQSEQITVKTSLGHEKVFAANGDSYLLLSKALHKKYAAGELCAEDMPDFCCAVDRDKNKIISLDEVVDLLDEEEGLGKK